MAKLTALNQEEMDNVIYDARSGDLETLKAIFDEEVDPKVIPLIKDEYTKATPFHMAAANGHSDVLKYLLSLVSDEDAKTILNSQNDSGNTALHWAAYNGHEESVKVLCEAGADPFIQNSFGHDTFYEAQNSEHEKLEDYLLEKFGNELESKEAGEVDEEKEDGKKAEAETEAEAEAGAEAGADDDLDYDDDEDLEVEFTPGHEIQQINEGGVEEKEHGDPTVDAEFLAETAETKTTDASEAADASEASEASVADIANKTSKLSV